MRALMKVVAVAGLIGVLVACSSNDEPEPREPAPTVTVTREPSVAPSAPSASSGSSTPKPSATVTDVVPTTAQEAIRGWLAKQNLEYAGPCEQTTLDQTGQYCSTVVEDRGAAIVVMVGPTFSEYVTYLLVERNGDRWIVTQAQEIPAPDENPTEQPLPF